MITKHVAGAAAAVRECMTVQLAASVTAVALSHKNQKQGFVMTLTNWPFPSYPPVPWTAKQEQEYQQAQRAQLPEAPL
jgi:hypothetical protein